MTTTAKVDEKRKAFVEGARRDIVAEEPKPNFFSERRLGLFTLNRELAEEDPESVMKALGLFLVVRCELMEYGNIFQYHAYSPLFREVELGEMIPEYTITLDDDGTVISAEEVKR